MTSYYCILNIKFRLFSINNIKRIIILFRKSKLSILNQIHDVQQLHHVNDH